MVRRWQLLRGQEQSLEKQRRGRRIPQVRRQPEAFLNEECWPHGAKEPARFQPRHVRELYCWNLVNAVKIKTSSNRKLWVIFDLNLAEISYHSLSCLARPKRIICFTLVYDFLSLQNAMFSRLVA